MNGPYEPSAQDVETPSLADRGCDGEDPEEYERSVSDFDFDDTDCDDDDYEPSAQDFEAWDEADQHRAYELCGQMVDEMYPRLADSDRDELAEAMEDSLSSVDTGSRGWNSLFDYDGPECHGYLSEDAERAARRAATTMRHEQMQRPVRLPTCTMRRRGDRRLRSGRPAPRRIVRATARGPDDPSGDPEPPLAAAARLLGGRL
jgi:hypothetical protein